MFLSFLLLKNGFPLELSKKNKKREVANAQCIFMKPWNVKKKLAIQQVLTGTGTDGKMHSRCFGIMRGHGNFVFNLVVGKAVCLLN
jgi:hypothetical protein